MDTTFSPIYARLFLSISRVIFRLNQFRLNLHFLTIEKMLSLKDVSHLSSLERERRKKCLQWISEYRVLAIFPVNTNHPSKIIPYFRDMHGTHCAVGYLMHRSGHDSLVNAITSTDNNIRVKDISNGPALDWIYKWGLTKKEAAWIQPGYPCGGGFGGPCATTLESLLMTLLVLLPYIFLAFWEFCSYLILRWIRKERNVSFWSIFALLTGFHIALFSLLQYFFLPADTFDEIGIGGDYSPPIMSGLLSSIFLQNPALLIGGIISLVVSITFSWKISFKKFEDRSRRLVYFSYLASVCTALIFNLLLVIGGLLPA